MPINWDEIVFDEGDEIPWHIHPGEPCDVEVVAYARKTGGYEVYVFEPEGTMPPDMEAERADENHVFIQWIPDSGGLWAVTAEIHERLGPEYWMALYYREHGSRRIIGKIRDRLWALGVRRITVGRRGEFWELRIPRKDFGAAGEVAASNVG